MSNVAISLTVKLVGSISLKLRTIGENTARCGCIFGALSNFAITGNVVTATVDVFLLVKK